MTAIAIPIPSAFSGEHSHHSHHNHHNSSPLSRSPFSASRSPFRRPSVTLASSPSRFYTITNTANASQQHSQPSSLTAKVISLPPTPPSAQDLVEPCAGNRPEKFIPPAPPPSAINSGSIINNFQTALSEIDIESCEAHGENAFFVCDLGEVYRQHLRWMKELGHRVQPFFAVKSNPDPNLLEMMSSLGMGFDCASQPEISAVLGLKTRPDPNRIIYANPCKAASFVRNAAKSGVDFMTFDNADELNKIQKYHPKAKMVLRILTDDSSSLCRLGLKFGAPLSEVRSLLKKANELEIEVVGISFHCGSGCKDPNLFGDAIRRARWAFDVGNELGYKFSLLDIGGGFEDENFEAISAVLRSAIDQHFPLSGGVRIIAEPGRYYVSRAFQLATNIIARRAAREGTNDENSMLEGMELDEDDVSVPSVMYYINDGVYGAFNCTLFDHQIVHPKVLTLNNKFVGETSAVHELATAECSVWGPTCDSIDVVQRHAQLPVDVLSVGDWLRWENMGAYTICAASQFNGFRKSLVRYTIDADPETEAKIRSLLA